MNDKVKKSAVTSPSYGVTPFGLAAPYISMIFFVFVIGFVVNLDNLARAFLLDTEDIQMVILLTSVSGGLIGFTATWSGCKRSKNLGAVFCALNSLVFVAYSALFFLYAHASK